VKSVNLHTKIDYIIGILIFKDHLDIIVMMISTAY